MRQYRHVHLVALALACTIYPVRAQPGPVELELKSYYPRIFSDGAEGIEVVGNLVFVADRGTYNRRTYVGGGLRILDVREPANPVQVEFWDNFSAWAVRAMENLVLVSSLTEGLQVLDVSDPATPIQLGSIDLVGGVQRYQFFARDLEVRGDLVFVSSRNQGLHVIDISDPSEPVRVGGWDSSGITAVEGVGNLVYAADYIQGLRVIHTSNPAKPVQVGGLDLAGSALDIEIAGNLAFIASHSRWNGTNYVGGGLQIVDVSDPVNPVCVGEWGPGRWISQIQVFGDRSFVAAMSVSIPTGASFSGGFYFYIIDVSNPTNPLEASYFFGGGYSSDFAVVGNLLFKPEWWGQCRGAELCNFWTHPVRVYDLSDPSNPVFWESLSSDAQRVEAFGDRAFLLEQDGIEVMDVSDSANLTSVGELSIDGVDDLSVVDDLGFFSTQNGIRVFDMSDLAEPVQVGDLDLIDQGGDLQVVDNLVYAIGAGPGMAIIEILPSEIIPSEAIQDLTLAVDASSLRERRKRALQASLLAALNSVERDQVNTAIRQLKAFQNKARAQVAKIDPQLATDLIGAGQEVLDALAK